MQDTLQHFYTVLADNGLTPGKIIADGTLHRCPTLAKPHRLNGAYICHLDTPPSIWWCNWETSEHGTYSTKETASFSPQEKEAFARRLEATREQRHKERMARHLEAAQQATTTLASSQPCPSTHSYLIKKGLPAIGDIRQGHDGALLIPVLSPEGTPQSLQRILEDGSKRFLTGGKIEGGSFFIPGDTSKALVVCEGYATGTSIHLAGMYSVYVAFSANNLPTVAVSLRKKFPQHPIIICADADDIGQQKGQEAATSAQASYVAPRFANGEGKDFNDLHQILGIEEVKRQLESAFHQHKPAQQSALIALEMGAFLELPLTERGYLLSPILPRQGIVILYASRGIGKTFLALSIALAVASGTQVMNWQAASPKRVLYVDGEMPAITMQERLNALISGMAPPPFVLRNLTIVTPDVQQMPMPDLSTISGQQVLEPLLPGIDMIVLDNISTLCRTGKENESQSWQLMQSWLLDLRRREMTVLLIHHAGKSGDQRGTSAREDIMDTVINLRRPKQYKMAEGARFEVHLTKARNLTGEEAEPFEAHLLSDENKLHWAVHKLEDVRLVELQKLLEEGLSIREAALEMDIPRSTVARLKKQLEASA